MANPPIEAPPDDLEAHRDAVLRRLIAVRESAITRNKPELLKEFPRWDEIAQHSQIHYEIGQVEIGLDYLELMMIL